MPASPASVGARAARILSLFLLFLFLGFPGAGCATGGTERNLAPLYSLHSTARGTLETEAFGGMLHGVRSAETGERLVAAVRPFWSFEKKDEGAWRSYFLPPLGVTHGRDGEVASLFYWVYTYRCVQRRDGTWDSRLLALPGVIVSDTSERGPRFGWFPFAGRVKPFFTYDEVVFYLWPFYVHAEAGGKSSTHVPWPLVGWKSGGGHSGSHVLPFYSHSKLEGRYDRWTFLWPFFHYRRDRLGGGGEAPQTLVWFFPVYGWTTRGTYRADTFLWPFFGYARDPRSDFWAFDFWPFVRFQRGGKAGVTRSRVWPFYGYLKADNLESRSYLWPLIHVREERYDESERHTFDVLPFWQKVEREDYVTGRTNTWRKLWPLYVTEDEQSFEQGAFPELDPFQRNHVITYHYSWLWRLWSWERDAGEVRRERSWLGLWRRERDAAEDRRALSFLWARRDYRDGAGAPAHETSLLFGLIRWRKSADEGFDLMAPAFPGPGWPLERAAAPQAAEARP